MSQKKTFYTYGRTLKKIFIFLSIYFLTTGNLFAQFAPVTISGFNNDVVAESGTSSLTTTTIPLDGAISSNKVMYTNTFRTTNGFGGGGIPDNGLITDASGSYQLAPYTGNNVLLLQRGQSGDLTIATPAKFTRIRILCFSTEGTSLVNATMFFTDGTSITALTNYSLSDWFNGTTNVVLQGFGRCTRATPTGPADAYPTNPRLYYIEIIVPCASQQKNLQKISFSNVTTAGNNAPYPNLVLWAISGRSYTQTITPLITPANCAGNNGSAALTVTGTTSPYTYSWNTVPVQTTATAVNLAPGNYQATIIDANACTTTTNVTIPLLNSLAMTVNKTDATCTSSGSIQITASGGSSYEYSINGGVSFQSSNIFNNLVPGTYNVITRTTAGPGCTTSQPVTIVLNNNLVLNPVTGASICRGASFTPNVTGNATAFSWTPTTGVSNPNIVNPVLTPASTTTYTVTGTLGTCSAQQSLTVTVFPGVNINAGPDATIIAGDSYAMQASGSDGAYLWTPATGLNATNILNPVANPTSTVQYTLRVTNAQGCFATDDVIITVLPYCVKIMEAFTPNGDGINDLWLVSNGLCVSNIKASVFNRYGSKVFESTDYKNNWDGTYKGKALPDGTYYYILDFLLVTGKRVIMKGNLTILR